MTKWTEEHCSDMPNELELIEFDTYIQRRNIREHEEGGYICECRFLTVSDYELLLEYKELEKQNEMLTECIIELADIIYA